MGHAVTGLNPAAVTDKSKSKQNLKACFFDFLTF